MVFRADPTPTDTLKQALSIAKQVVQQTQDVRNRAESGNLSRTNLLEYMSYLNGRIGNFKAFELIPGLAEEAQAQYPMTPPYDIVAEFAVMVAQMESMRDFVQVLVPLSADGFIKEFKPLGYAKEVIKLTIPQGVPVIVELDLLLAIIEV